MLFDGQVAELPTLAAMNDPAAIFGSLFLTAATTAAIWFPVRRRFAFLWILVIVLVGLGFYSREIRSALNAQIGDGVFVMLSIGLALIISALHGPAQRLRRRHIINQQSQHIR